MKKIIALILASVSALSYMYLQPADPLMVGEINVVKLTMLDAIGQSGGTGAHIIHPNGHKYILTNAHVCNNQRALDAEDFEGRHKTVMVIEQSKEFDLCLVEPISEEIPGIPLARKIHRREKVAVAGHPFLAPLTIRIGEILGDTTIQVLYGHIKQEDCTGFRRQWISNFFGAGCVVAHESMITDVEGFPGNSGSPLIDEDGKLVGVIFAGDNRSNKLFAVPLKNVKKFLESSKLD